MSKSTFKIGDLVQLNTPCDKGPVMVVNDLVHANPLKLECMYWDVDYQGNGEFKYVYVGANALKLRDDLAK